MENIGIFHGKQRTYNIQVLNLLFDNGPLTAWRITSMMSTTNRISLHAILSKRLHTLEKKDYVRKNGKLWLLPLKGIVATLLTQPGPKAWNPKWNALFHKNEEILNSIYSKSKIKIVTDKGTLSIPEFLDFSGKCDTFQNWVALSKVVKQLMEEGLVNLDLIKEKALFRMIILATANFDQLYPDSH